MKSSTPSDLQRRLLQQLTTFGEREWIVAFSGGVDSTVLLQLMVLLRDQGRVGTLSAVHIDHGLHEDAASWAQQCRSVCAQWKVHCDVVRVEIERSGDIERRARDARYSAFERIVEEGQCLLMAHHRDDQAETVLLRLFRGCGIDGLGGMPLQRSMGGATLARPLLEVTRKEIEHYAEQQRLPYIIDPSNNNLSFRRNRIRHTLIPEVEAIWPGVSDRLAALADEVRESSEILAMRTVTLADRVVVSPPSPLFGTAPVLLVDGLQTMSRYDADRVVRHWLALCGFRPPDRSALKTIFQQVVGAACEANPLFELEGRVVRRYQGTLVVTDKPSPAEGFCFHWEWQQQPNLQLPCGGVITVLPGGVCSLPDGPLSVVSRTELPAKMKFAVSGREGSKSVKRWLQDYRIPPWLRDSLPFVLDGEKMVALPGGWVAASHHVKTGEGYRFVWTQPSGQSELF